MSRKQIELKVRIGADSWPDVANALYDVWVDVEDGRFRNGGVASRSGFTFAIEVNEDREVRHDGYFKQLRAKLRRKQNGEQQKRR